MEVGRAHAAEQGIDGHGHSSLPLSNLPYDTSASEYGGPTTGTRYRQEVPETRGGICSMWALGDAQIFCHARRFLTRVTFNFERFVHAGVSQRIFFFLPREQFPVAHFPFDHELHFSQLENQPKPPPWRRSGEGIGGIEGLGLARFEKNNNPFSSGPSCLGQVGLVSGIITHSHAPLPYPDNQGTSLSLMNLREF